MERVGCLPAICTFWRDSRERRNLHANAVAPILWLSEAIWPHRFRLSPQRNSVITSELEEFTLHMALERLRVFYAVLQVG